MSTKDDQETNTSSDPINELFDLININKKAYLVQNDFIKFFESQDFPNGMEAFNTSRYNSYVENSTVRVTRNSFHEGFNKELHRISEELALLRDRISLEETIMSDIEKGTQNIDNEADDEEHMSEANLYISVLQIRKLNIKIDPNFRFTVVVESGDINLSTEPVYYSSGFALWPNERFALPIEDGEQDIVFAVCVIDQEFSLSLRGQTSYIGGFNINPTALQDQLIHKRYYKVYDNDEVVCEVLLNLLYIHNQVEYEDSKLERRRETYKKTSRRNKYLEKALQEKIQRMSRLRSYALFEELFSKDIELPNFLSPTNTISSKFKFRADSEETADYLSENPSIYEEENQIRVFLTSTDEERILFQRYSGEHDSPDTGDLIDCSTSKFDFPVTNSPEYMKMSVFDMRLSDLDHLQPSSSDTHKRSRTLDSRPYYIKQQRKRTADEGLYNSRNEGPPSLGFSYISEIDCQPSNDRERIPNSASSSKPFGLNQLNISEIKVPRQSMFITNSPNKPSPFHRTEARHPTTVFEESQSIMKQETNRTSPNSYRPDTERQRRAKEQFFEKAFLIGLAELMKQNMTKG